MNRGLFTSRTDEWETPQELFDELDREFHFGLDVCATNKNAKCRKYFTKKDNGLKKNWLGKGNVWMNPPYGRRIGEWIKKASQFILEMDYCCVALLLARTDTKWFHNYILDKAEIRFIKGRLKFGNNKNSAPFPSMIVIFR